jgi:hypothetical protein
VPRCSFSLHGVPRVGSPASSVLLKHSDSPLPFPLRFVAFAQRYRGGVPRFALTGGRTPDAREPGPFVAGGPPGALLRRHRGLPGSWTTLARLPSLSLDPGGSRRLDAASAIGTAFGSHNDQSFEARSRGHRARCLRFAVQVAPLHARLATGWWPTFAVRAETGPRHQMPGTGEARYVDADLRHDDLGDPQSE